MWLIGYSFDQEVAKIAQAMSVTRSHDATASSVTRMPGKVKWRTWSGSSGDAGDRLCVVGLSLFTRRQQAG